MAHYEKFTAAAVGHMCAHYDRQKDSDGNYVQYGNREIDPERIHLNYNMHGDDRKSMEIYRERIAQLKYMKRDDIIMMASCIVTIPADRDGNQTVEPENERAFFQICYDDLCRRHGKENVVSAWVHCDESGKSHMHFAFVPAVHSRKKRRGKDEYYDVEKICYDEAVTRKEYQSLHPDLVAAVELAEKETGIYLGSKEIMNGVVAENGRNYTVAQLKKLETLMNDEIIKSKEEAQRVLNDMNEAIGNNRTVLQDQAQEYNNTEEKIKSNEKKLLSLDLQIRQKENKLKELDYLLNTFASEEEYLTAADRIGQAFKQAADFLEEAAENPEKNMSKVNTVIRNLQIAISSILKSMVGYEIQTEMPLEKCRSESIRNGFDEYLKSLEKRKKTPSEKQKNYQKENEPEH